MRGATKSLLPTPRSISSAYSRESITRIHAAKLALKRMRAIGSDVASSRVVEVVLPNKTVALVRATEMDAGGGPAEKVAWKDTFDFEHVAGTLEGVAQAIRTGLEKVKPARTTVEFGIELAVKSGKLTGMLVEGDANASLRVTLEWGSDRSANNTGAA